MIVIIIVLMMMMMMMVVVVMIMIILIMMRNNNISNNDTNWFIFILLWLSSVWQSLSQLSSLSLLPLLMLSTVSANYIYHYYHITIRPIWTYLHGISWRPLQRWGSMNLKCRRQSSLPRYGSPPESKAGQGLEEGALLRSQEVEEHLRYFQQDII